MLLHTTRTVSKSLADKPLELYLYWFLSRYKITTEFSSGWKTLKSNSCTEMTWNLKHIMLELLLWRVLLGHERRHQHVLFYWHVIVRTWNPNPHIRWKKLTLKEELKHQYWSIWILHNKLPFDTPNQIQLPQTEHIILRIRTI